MGDQFYWLAFITNDSNGSPRAIVLNTEEEMLQYVRMFPDTPIKKVKVVK